MISTKRNGMYLAAAALAGSMTLAACGGDSGSGGGSGSGSSAEGGSGDGDVAVTLITKTATNPFFVAMQKGAEKAGSEQGVSITTTAGKIDGDEDTQIRAIEDAVIRGDDGILITPNGPGVNSAIEKARDQGLYVIALDTPPEPADIVDITFATDNFKAGELIGEWTKAQLDGEKAVIALLDVFNDRIISVDYNRDQGFLTGMGIDTKNPKRNGDEDPTGSYDGGEYEIVCNEPTEGAEDGGRTAMENCLTKNQDINVVYAINEPAAVGAYGALKQAGSEDAIIVAVDGGCDGIQQVKDGVIGATSQQYPVKMAELGVEAIKTIAGGGEAPKPSEGLDFFNTGVELVTDEAVPSVDSISTDEGAELCWG